MANSVFSVGTVMTVSVEGLAEAQARLNRADKGLSVQGIERQMTLATGMVHRYLLGLSRAGTPPRQQGVLPVVTGRLRNSFFWQVRRAGGSVIGQVGSNVDYGPGVEARRRFLTRTVRDQTEPVNRLLAAHVRQVTA